MINTGLLQKKEITLLMQRNYTYYLVFDILAVRLSNGLEKQQPRPQGYLSLHFHFYLLPSYFV